MESQHNHRIDRVLRKLETAINNGNYYEAHQMYRTLYFRYLGQNRFSDLIQLLYNGCLLLLQRKQYTSGADLGVLFVDVLRKSEIEPSEIYFKKLIDIFSSMNPTYPERDTFVQNALRWSTFKSNLKMGHPMLHEMLANVYWVEKNYSSARQHFLHGEDGFGCSSLLLDVQNQRGYTNEIDIFITQTVLQYLCLQQRITANKVFKSYIDKHPKISGGPPFKLPLLNFLFFLLKIVEIGNLSVFTILCEQYLICLNADPCFLQYLNKIGQLFFNMQLSQRSNKGLFNSFLQSFFNDHEDEYMIENQQATLKKSDSFSELD